MNAGMIEVAINGQPREIPEGTTVAGLFDVLGLDPEGLLIERNKTVVSRSAFGSERIEPGDRLEILRFIGGG